MKNSIYKKENPQNLILINCLIQIFFLFLFYAESISPAFF